MFLAWSDHEDDKNEERKNIKVTKGRRKQIWWVSLIEMTRKSNKEKQALGKNKEENMRQG